MTSQFLSIKKIDFCVEISEFLVQNHGRGEAFFLGFLKVQNHGRGQAFFGDFLKDFPYEIGRNGFVEISEVLCEKRFSRFAESWHTHA